MMMLALLTGIVAHRRFFVDFFTFRPGKAQRSWLDAHNLLAVTALPFHLMIAFTGALTLANLVMPWGALSAYHGDSAALYRDIYPAAIDRPAAGRSAPLAPIEPMLVDAERRFGGGLFEINVSHPGDAAAVVTVIRAEDARIGIQAETMSFDGTTGRLLVTHDEHRPALATFNILYGLHTARFAETTARWLYFLCGIALTVMIGAGLLLWTAKRRQHRRDVGFALVERLNSGFIGGTPIAFATFFIANRLLPTEIAHRADWEVRAVFWSWGALLVFSALRWPKRSWRELLALAALACLAIPVADVATGKVSASLLDLGVDGTALAFASLFAAAARLFRKTDMHPATRGRHRGPAA
jgi:hypothetical protein